MTSIGRKTIKAEIIDSVAWCGDEVFAPALLHFLLEFDPAHSREKLVEGLRRTIRQVPMLGCRLERGTWRDRWVHIPDLDPGGLIEETEVSEDPPGVDFQDQAFRGFARRAHEAFDISKGPPFRLLVFRRGEKGLLVFRFHHALSDGNGCLEVLRLFAKNIAKDAAAETPLPVPMERSYFQVLRSFGLRDVPGVLHEIAVETLRPWALFFSKPLIQFDYSASPSAQRTACLESLVIRGDDYRSLLKAAREHGLTINDMLTAALLAVAAEYNSKTPEPSRFLNVIFTVNLRRFLPESGVRVANISGDCFLVSRPERVQSFAAAAAEVSRKTGEMKRKYMGVGFVLAPQLMSFFMPSSLLHFFARNYVGFLFRQAGLHSMAMTNIGAMDDFLAPFGESLRHASFIGPIWEIPFPFVSVTGFRDSITIYFPVLRPSGHDSDTCRRFADRMRYYLLEWPDQA